MQLNNRNRSKFLDFSISFILLLSVSTVGCGKAGGAHMKGGFPVSVIAVPVSEEKIEDKISLVGTLAANEAVDIKNQISGLIEQIGFEEGQKVKKGQMLFMIDANKLNATLAQAEANLGMAKTTFDRLSSLIAAGAVSQQEFDQAKSDYDSNKAEVDLIKAQLKESVITASFDGVTGDRKVSLGQFVSEGTILTSLINQNPMKAEFNVPERFLGQLKEKQTIELMVAAYPEEKFEGHVYFIDPKVEEATRTALVKAKVPNEEGKLRSGMFANLELIVSIRPKALTVPETALIPRGEDVNVFVVDAESKAQIKTVKVGVRMAGKAEITSGLIAGEMVITEGYQKVGPGSLVNIKDLSQDKPEKK